MSSTERPNILFLMTDEHRYDVNGFAGNSVIRTPVLDNLARDAVIFDNAYSPSPICVPGRQCMASGQLPRTCDCENYGDDLAPGYMTFSRLFSQHAYMTTAAGKLHHMGSDQMQGWRRRVGMDHMNTHGPRGIEGAVTAEFDKVKPGVAYDGKWSIAREIKRAGIGNGPHTSTWDEYATLGMQHIIHEYFLDSYYDKTKHHMPHLLYLGFNNPHYPYFAPQDLFEYYLNRVPLFTGAAPFEHPWLGMCTSAKEPITMGPAGDITEREARRATAAYYANIEMSDRRFGRVIESLEHSGQNLDNWIIVFTADHGEMLGQHSIWEKQKFFEASARVPLFIRYPKGFQGDRRISENVNLCDLFATLCDLCSLPVPAGLDSRSMVPLLNGDTSGWDDESVSQMWGKYLMIKKGDLKYQYYGPDMPEVLFDLDKNPAETVNFAADPHYRDAVTAFRGRCGELGFGPAALPGYKNAGYRS